VQLVADRVEARVDDEIDVARAQATALAEEAEREARGQLEAGDEDVAALRERLLDALLGARGAGRA